MKLRYFAYILVASAALATACQKEVKEHYLSEVTVSTSYVSIPMEGGSASFTVTTTESWAMVENFSLPTGEKDEDGKEIYKGSVLPAWLNATSVSGSAGTVEVVLSAEETLDGREATLKISCGDKIQNVNVIQGIAVISEATCAEISAGPDSKTYIVTGVVTSLNSDTYGNFYLSDDTGSIYIYGTKNSSGQYPKDAGGWGKSPFDFGVGDEVTVQGPKTTYNGTVELVDVQVLNVSKSLIKVESIDPEDGVIPKDGGTLTVNLTNKGDDLSVEIPEAAGEWLFISAISGNVVTLKAIQNEGGDRSATVVFKTTQSGKEYSTELSLYQTGAIIECSIAEFLEAEVGDTQYRLTGVVTGVANTDYGNIYLRDWSGETYVYGIGEKGFFETTGIEAGDIVTLIGKRAEYKENPQVGGAVLESQITVIKDKTLAEIAAADDDPDVLYMATGTITEIANAEYGNVYLDDGESTLYVYGCYPGWGASGDNRKNMLETAGIEVGDVLTVIGAKTTYKDNPQISNGIYFSHEKAE